jgi:hypothetical protein
MMFWYYFSFAVERISAAAAAISFCLQCNCGVEKCERIVETGKRRKKERKVERKIMK